MVQCLHKFSVHVVWTMVMTHNKLVWLISEQDNYTGQEVVLPTGGPGWADMLAAAAGLLSCLKEKA